MGFALDDDGTAPCFEPIRRVAPSYLGVLWIAADKRGGPKGTLALLRRVRLPKDTPTEVRDAITRAAAAARDLRHPNIMSVIGVLEDGAELGIAYEHVDGEPLRSLQSSAELRGLSFPIPVSLRIAVDLLLGLETLHQAHTRATTSAPFGGLSPDSVLVSRKGETKLLDALVASCASLLDAIGSNTEKLGYAAPEQVRPGAPLTAQSDLFAVGAVLWELLTGRRLLAGTRSVIERKLLEHDLPRLSDVIREGQAVSPALAAIVDAALAADPRKRPVSARALAVQLRDCGHPVASRDELAQFVAELSARPSEPRVAAAQATPLPPSQPQPAPASVSSARSIRLPMPARARSRAERSPSPAPLTARPRPPISTLPGLSKALAGGVTTAQSSATQPAARAPAARVDTPAPDVLPAPPERRTTPARQTLPQRQALLDQPAPTPKPTPPRAAARSAAQRLPSRPRVSAAVVAPPKPAPPERTRPEITASPEPAPPELEMSEVEVSELEVSELEVSEVGSSELVVPEVFASEPAMSAESTQPPPAMAVAPAPIAQPEEPVPSSALRAFSLPPTPIAPRPTQALLSSGSAQRAWPPRWLRHRGSLGLLGAALGVGAAFAVDSALGLPSADADAAAAAPVFAALPAAATLPALRAAAAPADPDSKPLPEAPASDSVPVEAAALQTAEPGAEATAENAAPPASGPGDFHLETLGDRQLVAAFALEQRRDVSACSERLGADTAAYTGNQPQTSRARFNAARRALQRGQVDTAYTELCIATAHDLDNVDAQRSLAELALDLGDPARAKEVAERGLARAPKNFELLGVLGDALAILGEIPESRRLWLETVDEKSPEAERSQRLAASYQKAGERSLSSFNFARARSYFRRALILTEGSYEASLGLADALLWLEQGRAGFAWAERAARALPASARAQILLGDAYAKNGELDSARDAWRAAQLAEPGNGIAARRLSRGPR